MNWPSVKDFSDAVRSPATAFTDPELAAADPVVGAGGLPIPQAGDSSDVYQLCAEDGRSWAVKCFARPAHALAQRYTHIQESLSRAAPPFAVGFQFLADGIFAGEEWCPVLKMDWVEGDHLSQVAREKADNPGALEALSRAWVELCRQLRAASIAHGDLQHDNVLVVPGEQPDSLALKLTDYDGMFVPALSGSPPGESGHPNYRHPARATEGAYSADIDRFPLLVVATALKGLAVLGRPLWDRYDTGDNMLFTVADFQNPGASPLIRELWRANDRELRMLVGKLVLACGQPLAETPWIDELAASGAEALTVDEALAVADVLAPTVAPAVPAPAARVVPLAEAFTLDPVEPRPAPSKAPDVARAKQKAKTRREEEEPRRVPLMPLAILAALLLLAGAATAVVLIANGPKPDETAELPPSEPPPASVPVPPGPPEVAPEPHPAPPAKPVFQGPAGFHKLWEKPIGQQRGFVKVTFAADGRSVFLATTGQVEVFDAGTGESKLTLRGQGVPLIAQQVWALGDRVAVFGHPLKSPALWDAKTGEALGSLVARDPLPPPDTRVSGAECQLSPDGKFLFIGNQGAGGAAFGPAQYRVVEVATGKALAGGEWRFGSARFTADGSRMLMVESTGRVRWLKLHSGEVETEWAFPQIIATHILAGMSADGSLINYFGRPGGLPPGNYLLDGKTGQVLRKLAHGTGLSRSAVSADGRWVVAILIDPPDLRPSVVISDARTGAVLVRTPVGETPNDVVQADFTPDGKSVVIHDRAKHEVAVYELRGEVPPVPPGARVPDPLTAVPERAKPGEAVVVDPQLPVPPKPPIPRPPIPPPFPRRDFPDAPALKARWTAAPEAAVMANGMSQAPLFTKDGKTLVLSGGTAGTILTFDAKTGAAGAVFDGHKGPGGVYWLSPVGDDRVASRGFDAKHATWDIKTANRLDDIKFPELPPMPEGRRGHAGITHAVSPSGRYTAQARKESAHPTVAGPLRVLDTQTGKEIVSAGWNGGRVLFTADESRVFVLDGLGKAAWYKLPSGEADGEWATGDGVQAEFARVLGMTAEGKTMIYHGPLKNQRGGVFLLDGKTGDVLRRLGGAPYQPNFSTISPDGRFVAMGVIDFANGPAWHLDVFEVSTWNVVGRVSPPPKAVRQPAQFSFTPDSKELAVFFPLAKELSVFPLPEGPKP